MTTVWQQLGAFVSAGVNLREDQLASFAQSGGRWIVPVLYGDDATGPWNLANIEGLKGRADHYGVATGGWFNCWNKLSADQEAANIAAIVKEHQLKLAVLDCELAFQYPVGDPSALAPLLRALRALLPSESIAVSTNSLNDSFIYNGRTLTPPQSFYDLGVRVLPQWYNSPAYGQGTWTRPDQNMQWLKANGATNGNFRDSNAPKVSYRGVPLSYVHGTLEGTGLEGADLAAALVQLRAARAFGYTYGWSYYLLENAPPGDFSLMAAERGVTFLV